MARTPAGLVVTGDALHLGEAVKTGSCELAYLDPPFSVGTTFGARRDGKARAHGPVAYDDRWPSLEAYLAWLEPRIAAARELLSDEGTTWLHLDQRAVHEAKTVCDRVFGRARFAGEIVWVPGNGSKSRKGPGIGHQTLLVYTRTKTFVWNAKDPVMREPYARTSLSMHFTHEDADGRAYRERTISGKTYRYYADGGRAIGSVWTDCPAMVANTPLMAETTGYPTQKPLKLLDRIVRASTRPGALVADPFMGSGTTLVAAHACGRRFAGSDIGDLAVKVTCERLDRAGARYEVLTRRPS